MEARMERITTSVADARKALGIGNTKIYELINSGQLDTIRIGRRRLIKIASIERLAELTVDPR